MLNILYFYVYFCRECTSFLGRVTFQTIFNPNRTTSVLFAWLIDTLYQNCYFYNQFEHLCGKKMSTFVIVFDE